MKPGKYTIRIEDDPPEPDRSSGWAMAMAGAALILAAAAMAAWILAGLGA